MKVRCNNCKFMNKEDHKCSIKKIKLKLNKPRKCVDYIFDEQKDIERLEQKARVMDQQDRAYRKRAEVIKNLDRFKSTASKAEEAHPVTGDLSRFKSSASEE